MIPIAILAGGLATRLGAITETIPKALLEVAGKPFVVHQLEVLKQAGIHRVVLCVAHFAEQIEHELGDGRAFGMDIAYSHDRLEGTGGALRRALPLLGPRFLTMYGDSYLECDYAAIAAAWQASGKAGLMTVYKNDGKYDASNVEYRDGRVVRYDKTQGVTGLTHIDWGLGGFDATAFAGYPDGKLDLAAVYRHLLAQDELFGYEVTNRFYEIGSVTGLDETRRLLSTKGHHA